jgi:hypothetical protein
MTTVQRDAIASPAEGLMIYNTDNNCIQFYDGSTWSQCLGMLPANELQCTSVSVHGVYTSGEALTANNYIAIDVAVNAIGSYTITTNTVNSYSFSASGTFPTTGIHTVNIMGTGTPSIDQTDVFTITLAGSAKTCSASVMVSTVKKDCLAWLNDGYNTNGVYSIDPDGAGGNDAFNCYCDMTTDGGGWTKVITQDDNTIAYMSRFSPTNNTWQQEFTGDISWNVNDWSSTEDYIISFDFDDVRYSWIPGRYDNSGLGKAIVTAGSTQILNKSDSHSNNGNGQTIRENTTTICSSCTTNYTSIRTGVINLPSTQSLLKISFTDYLNYNYNKAQIRELWVR